MFDWIEDFLKNRTIQVRVGDQLSETYRLENGTAQGEIISPLLFLIMVNDLADELKDVQTLLFADDSAVFKSGRNINFIAKKISQV